MQKDINCYNDGISISEKKSKVPGIRINYLETKNVSYLCHIVLKSKLIPPIIFQQNFHQVPPFSRH